jgi:signal transduction histidine kinase
VQKKVLSTVSNRLTLTYTLLFALLSLVAFLLVYVHIAHNLNKQTDHRLRATISELSSAKEEGGEKGLLNEFIRESEATGKERIFFRLLDSNGGQVLSSDLDAWKNLKPFPLSLSENKEQISRQHFPGHEFPARIITVHLEDGFFLQAGVSDDKDEVLESYREIFSTALLLILVLGGIGSHLIARRAMGGVREVTEAAARIAAGDMDKSISSGNRGEEIEALAIMFNTMQERIAGLIGELKGVVNNVAHDLRMPITRMRGIAETTLISDADISSYRDMAVTVIEESDRLVGQINTILELAEIDAGLRVLSMEEIDLAKLVHMAVELYQPAAEQRDIHLTVRLEKQAVPIVGNLSSLQRLLANLLDNAIKFSPAAGEITITLISSDTVTILSVADNGPGIQKEDRERIFDRFYRGDASRSISGNGLGLALVKSIALLHNGTVNVDSDGKNGSCFVVRLRNK